MKIIAIHCRSSKNTRIIAINVSASPMQHAATMQANPAGSRDEHPGSGSAPHPLATFMPDAASARVEFDRGRAQAAWFISTVVIANPSGGFESNPPVQAVRVPGNRTFLCARPNGKSGESAAREALLYEGGVLVQMPDKAIRAYQFATFALSHNRCFSDGTRICSLGQSQMEQAMALSAANSQMRLRIQETFSEPLVKSILKFWKMRPKQQALDQWNDEIRAHIRDLTRYSIANKTWQESKN